MKKFFTWGWIVLILGILLLGVGVVMHGNKAVTFDNWKPSTVHNTKLKKEYSKIGKFNSIDVTTTEADLTIVKGDSYAVEYDGKTKHKPSVEVENQRLIIKQKESTFNEFHLSFYYNEHSEDTEKITITVPQKVSLNDIKVKTDSGNVTVNDQGTASLGISSVDGDLTLNNVTASKANFALQEGDLIADNVGFNAGKISQTDGDLTMKASKLNQVEVQNRGGDVSYTDVDLINGGLKMQDGDFSANQISINGGYDVDNSSGDNTVVNAQAGGYHLTTSDGSNRLYGRSSDSDVVQNSKSSNILRLTTSDGDNEVK